MTTKKSIRLPRRHGYKADSVSSALPTFRNLLIHLWQIAVFPAIERVHFAELPPDIDDISNRQKLNAHFRQPWLGGSEKKANALQVEDHLLERLK